MTQKASVNQFNTLKKMMDKFVEERDWREYHNPKNLAISIAIESSELMELFQWDNPTNNEVMVDEDLMAKLRDEIADVMIYSISLASSLNIDLFACIKEKMTRNSIRFPAKNPKK
ncbi:MAG: nucleotide pyrophosphohydrolase [Candidatus Heimdallarchaeota archaeon]